jgi:hypothetical protein
VSLDGGTASFVDKNVGTDKPVAFTCASLAGDGAANYGLSGVSDAAADITARPITITANAKSKLNGAADPALTYRLTGGTLVGTDALTGALERDAGEAVGQYDILQGTVNDSDGNGGNNYDIDYVGAKRLRG